ncbi:MAG: hypothetical protein ACFE95_06690 [Candidatus Hodarchaeota archaeon]
MSEKISQKPIIEPAKSARSSCRICQKKIEKDSIRIGVPSPYTLPDGRTVATYRYYHPECVPYDRIIEILEILSSMSTIEPMEKNQVKKTLERIQKKGSENVEEQRRARDKPFFEYSRSGRGTCRICENKIAKGIFRVAEPTKIDLTDGRQIFGQKLFHVNCFFNSLSNPKSVFQSLMDTSVQRKKISKEELKNLKDNFQVYLSENKTASDVLEIIGEAPVKIGTLKKVARKKGIPFKLVEQAIEEGLMRGEYFQPSPKTIQKLG